MQSQRSVDASADEWQQELSEFVRGRVSRLQAAAQYWLGTMTTLLGLFSALVVLDGGNSLAVLSVPTWLRAVLFGVSITIYALVSAAVVTGARATFGGTALVPGSINRPPGVMSWLRDRWTPAPLAPPADFGWEDFRDLQLRRSERLRLQLHRSRALGVLAVFLVGALALVVLGIRTFSAAPDDPTFVIVVREDGSLTCGQIDRREDGKTYVGNTLVEDARDVMKVGGC